MKRRTVSVTSLLPMCTMLIVLLVFTAICGGQNLTGYNLSSVVDQSLTVMIGGMGMIFVLSHGGIDLSIGSLACVCAYAAAGLAMPYGVIAVMLTSIGVGALSGLLAGTIVSRFKVPSFMVTVALQTGLRGVTNFLATSTGVILNTPEINRFNDLSVKLPVLALILAVLWYIFEYTRLGKYSKAIGENELCCQISGINVPLIKTLDFIISGAVAGIAGIFMLARTGGISNMIGKSFEMRVIMALLLGSVPVVGGMDSKMFKVIIGALTVLLLENGLSVAGITGGLYQLIEGIMLVVVCVVTGYVKKRSALHDEKMMVMLKHAEHEHS